MIRMLITPAKLAEDRRQEADATYRGTLDLAQRMPAIPDEQKHAAGRTIIHGWKSFLAYKNAQHFFEAEADRVESGHAAGAEI